MKTFLKFILAGGILYWLVASGKLDFKILSSVLHEKGRLSLAFLIIIINLLLITYRLKLILEIKSKVKIPFLKLVNYNWIGLFFNAVLPGSVSGDLIKIFYINKLDTSLSKKFLLGTVFVDRVIGLTGLVFILGISSFLNYSEFASLSQNLKMMIDFNLALLFCAIISFILLFTLKRVPKKIAPLWNSLRDLKGNLVRLTAISVVVQFLSVILFWTLTAPFADTFFDLKHAFSFVPIGFIAMAIPISPSGLGVGHALFFKLFSYFNVTNGASLFNIYFFVTLFGNILGAIPYLFLRKDKNL